MNFRFARDQVAKANDFFAVFSTFELGRYNKTLNEGPRGKQ